jgi:ArsR family transcriptional regulator
VQYALNTRPEPHPNTSSLDLLKLLADDVRWRIVGELRRSDRQVSELVTQLKLPQNLVSYHLGLLRQSGLVQVRRSDADARAVYYGLDITVLDTGLKRIGGDLLLPATAAQPLPNVTALFLCTGNTARSQMAEGWLRYLSGGRVQARSAGTEPRAIHPLTVQVMVEAGVDIGYQQAKEISALDGLKPDVVVTVCDRAREQCPDWPGHPMQLHWSIPDPVRVPGSEEERLHAFRAARDELHVRITALLPLLTTLTP